MPLSKKNTLEDWLAEKGINVPDHLKIGLGEYLRIRNWLHHRDGQNDDGSEIHLYPQHLDQFYDLFVWLASAIAAKSPLKDTS